MNERIKELAGETLDHAMPQTWCSVSPDELNRILEKFAELIVRECVKVAVFKDSGTVATTDVAGHMAAGRSIAAQMIKEHFGVEE